MTPLTSNRLRELLSYDSATGEFTWRAKTSPKSRVVAGEVAGCQVPGGYRYIQVEGVLYLAHRLAWLHVHGKWPCADLDHKDGVKSSNAIANLRLATDSENAQNQTRTHSNNKSGLLGVAWNKKTRKWDAFIKVNRKSKNLGGYDSPADARHAYLKAKAQFHPFSTIGLRA